MSEKGSHAGEGADEGGDGAAELKKIELTEDELNAAISAFNKYDVDRRGVRLCDLKKIYEAMGETLRDEEMFNMMCDAVIQESPAGVTILFSEFLRLVRQRKERLHSPVSESDLLMAYVACGGEQDGEGHVERDVLVKLIKQDFELAINIEEMIAQVDEDGSGEIEFGEFCELLAEK